MYFHPQSLYSHIHFAALGIFHILTYNVLSPYRSYKWQFYPAQDILFLSCSLLCAVIGIDSVILTKSIDLFPFKIFAPLISCL